MKKLYGLIGAGGYGREVMPLVIDALQTAINNEEAQVMFVVEQPEGEKQVNNYRVLSFDEYQNMSCPKKFNIAIGDSRVRQRIAEKCNFLGITPFSIIAPTAVVMAQNTIAMGAILSPFVTITSNAVIGKFFHANIYSYVAHDCIIGDYVTFAPGVKCNGNVHIGDHAYLGTGAIIKPGSALKPLKIGEGSIVGMGAVVTKDVPPHTTVVGNPARILVKS